jgi:CysZ protein
MLTAFFLAFGDVFAAHQRRALIVSLLSTLALLAVLWAGASILLQLVQFTGFSWLDRALGVLGSLSALVFAWLVFPAMSATTTSLFLYGVADSVESRHYPGLPPPRRQSFREIAAVTLRLAGLAIILNLIALPFYLWPAINLVVYYGLNGYLVAREYFVLVALRRLDRAAADRMWRRYRFRLVLTGAAIAFILSLPVVNLVAPVWATAFLLHVFEHLRAGAPNVERLSGIEPTSRV